jgi:eukaryotic-like serine/threonine-protein kinase
MIPALQLGGRQRIGAHNPDARSRAILSVKTTGDGAPPAILGNWKIVDPLGEGGQAHTFKVVRADGSDSTMFVLKRLKNVNRLERFRKEIEVLRALDNPNIVRVLDFDLEAAKPYYVMEYCPDGSLADHPTRWAGDPVGTLRMFAVICDAVYWANLKDVIHRDIKPSNIRCEGCPTADGDARGGWSPVVHTAGVGGRQD